MWCCLIHRKAFSYDRGKVGYQTPGHSLVQISYPPRLSSRPKKTNPTPHKYTQILFSRRAWQSFAHPQQTSLSPKIIVNTPLGPEIENTCLPHPAFVHPRISPRLKHVLNFLHINSIIQLDALYCLLPALSIAESGLLDDIEIVVARFHGQDRIGAVQTERVPLANGLLDRFQVEGRHDGRPLLRIAHPQTPSRPVEMDENKFPLSFFSLDCSTT